jgi:hypothetical protein
MAMWAGGVAWGASAVASWRVVGRGFLLLGSGVALLLGVPAAVLNQTPQAVLAGGACLVAMLLPGRSVAPSLALAVGAGGFILAGGSTLGLVPALIGALALGGITSEMLLGHWYLIDPRLPRSALRRLAAAGLAGVMADAALVAFRGGAGGLTAPWVPVLLAVVAALLMLGVLGALRVQSYPGVMAATGLSYLAVLTSLGAVVVGQSLL